MSWKAPEQVHGFAQYHNPSPAFWGLEAGSGREMGGVQQVLFGEGKGP